MLRGNETSQIDRTENNSTTLNRNNTTLLLFNKPLVNETSTLLKHKNGSTTTLNRNDTHFRPPSQNVSKLVDTIAYFTNSVEPTPTAYVTPAQSMMRNIQALAESFSNLTEVFFPNVRRLLSKPWKHDVQNVTYFRYSIFDYH